MIRGILAFDIANGYSADEISALERNLRESYQTSGVAFAKLNRFAGELPVHLVPNSRSHAFYDYANDDAAFAGGGHAAPGYIWDDYLFQRLSKNQAFFQFRTPDPHYSPWAERVIMFDLPDANSGDLVNELRDYLPPLWQVRGVYSPRVESMACSIPQKLLGASHSHALIIGLDNINLLKELDANKDYQGLDARIHTLGRNIAIFQTNI